MLGAAGSQGFYGTSSFFVPGRVKLVNVSEMEGEGRGGSVYLIVFCSRS